MTQFANRLTGMEKSATIVRNLFNSMNDPEVISFGGGAPAKDALPIEQVNVIVNEIMHKNARGIEALQYGGIMGIMGFRRIIAEMLLAPIGVEARAENIMVVNGGLETMNLLCQVIINPGDVILVESPTFVHGIEIFEMFGARCIACDMDNDGVIVEDVETKIKKYAPKIVYTIPTFHNPTGRTLSLERRKELAELGSKYDVIILEDDPYREIRYSGEPLAPIKSFDKTGHTVFANSFSKIFSPGSRIGYVLANDDIMKHLFDAKTATNSHTSTFVQVVAEEFLKRGYYPEHIKMVRDLYRNRRDVMIECINKFFPQGTKHTYPDGGLFVWAELPNNINATELLAEAVKDYKVAYVAGEGFFCEGNGKGSNCMRLSFGSVEPEKINTGMERLGRLVSAKVID